MSKEINKTNALGMLLSAGNECGILSQKKSDEHILYHADPDCEHEIVGGDNYSGIKCRKCGGWYCA